MAIPKVICQVPVAPAFRALLVKANLSVSPTRPIDGLHCESVAFNWRAACPFPDTDKYPSTIVSIDRG
jgi:hypothetical protein